MHLIDISIEEFLARSLDASIRTGYAAIVVPIARTADGKELQDELIRSWHSLDNLTNDRILVIMPRVPERYNKTIIPYDRVAYGTGTYGINDDLSILGNLPSPTWQKIAADPKEKTREALTKVATETARFFGIPEQYLPCVVILSLRERHLFILPFSASFSLYAFIRSLIIEYQPIIDRMQGIKERQKDLQKKEQNMTRINGELKREIWKYRHKKDKDDMNKEIIQKLRIYRKEQVKEIKEEKSKRDQDIQNLVDELNRAEQELPLSKVICLVAGQYALKPKEIHLELHNPLSSWHRTLMDQGFMSVANVRKPSEEPTKQEDLDNRRIEKTKGQLHMKEKSTKQAPRWSELFAILLVVIVVLSGLGLVAYFISPFVLWLVLIAGLLFVILIIVYLKGPAELSEANFMQIILRLFDALPLLRPNREVSRRENDEPQQVNASQAPLQPSPRGSSSNRTKTDVKP